MKALAGIIAGVGFALALPGLLLIQLADRIDEAETVRRLTRELER